MRVLLIDAFATGSCGAVLAEAAVQVLQRQGHQVDCVELSGSDFETFMSAQERAAYHEADPLVSPATRASADLVKSADALLFCYPTTTFTIPAVLKSWIERVLVPGVAFVFDESGRVRPGMTNIRRIGAITTTGHSPRATRRARDGGRRTIMWNLRLSCHHFCRRTFVRIPTGSADVAKVRRALGRWQ